nr:hypothetical protein [Tanacetum cinerariifolium]
MKPTTATPPQGHHHHIDTTTVTPPHGHHHNDTTTSKPFKHHTSPHNDTRVTGVTTIERYLHRETNHHKSRPPRQTPTKRLPENLSPPWRSAASIENTSAAPKMLLPPLLNILCC